jgi:hypothetical protein
MNSKASSEENEFKTEEILDPLSEALKKVESLTAELKAARDELKITKENADRESLTAELKAVRDELKITKENADSAAKRYQPDSGECSINYSYDRVIKFDYQFGFHSFDIVTYLWRSHKQLIFLENHTQYFIVEKLLILNKLLYYWNR